jgi:hypothetical protein
MRQFGTSNATFQRDLSTQGADCYVDETTKRMDVIGAGD